MRWLGAEADAAAYQGADPVWMWPGWAAMGDPGKLAIVVGGALALFGAGAVALAPSVAAWARASFGSPSVALTRRRAQQRGLSPRSARGAPCWSRRRACCCAIR
ncbi:MAG: hypothetical protein HZY79_09285 [Rhodoblastus sp.]|nr:MAG: hypothetical protein HZY79_09285 [Rhodoblastus sp.]